MLRQRIRRLILVLASLFVAEHSFADDCSFLKRDPLELRDRLSTPGRNSFLRINDLEAVTANGLDYSRSSENQWSLAP
jgi:hypothetical protein